MKEFKQEKKMKGLKQTAGFVMAFCLAATPVGNIPMVHASEAAVLTSQTQDQTQDQIVAATSIVLDQKTKEVVKGESFTLTATVAPEDTTDKTVVWSTSDEKVATVNNGVVTAVGKGTAKIKATTTNGLEATCKLTVKVPSTSISLKKTKATVYKGKTVKLKAVMAPKDTSDKITWTSSNNKVAKVVNGVVKGIKKGTATITATTTSGKKASCKITVKAVSTKSVKLNKEKISIVKGQKAKLKAIINPKKSTDKVTWKSSNKKVATVKNGVIKGLKSGKAVITVKVGKKKATCTVVVKEVKAKSIKLNKSSIKTFVGKTITLKAKVKPKNTTDTITWTSSNDKVATVKEGVVTAVAKGKAVIEAKVGKKVVKCKVTVKTPADSITLAENSIKVKVGSKTKLKATIAPANSKEKITWKSSNKKVASVTANGVVKGIKKGTAKITAKTESGKKTTCTVTVE